MRNCLLPGRNITVVDGNDRGRVAAHFVAAATPPPWLPLFACTSGDWFFASLRALSATPPAIAAGLTPAAIVALGTLTPWGPASSISTTPFAAAPFATARTFGRRFRASPWRSVLKTCSETVVRGVLGLNEAGRLWSRSFAIAVGGGTRGCLFVVTPTTASTSPPAKTSVITLGRIATDRLFGIVETRGRRSRGLHDSRAERIVIVHRWG